jgi:hypothetical protein
MTSGATVFWRISLVGIALSAASHILCSQETSVLPQTRARASEPFAGVDDSLTRAADTLLNASVQATPPETGKTDISHAAVVSPTQDDQESKPSVEGKLSIATLRLNLLRPVVEPILMNHGVPADLSAVILVESGGRADALSPKGARGLWQLMPDTARRYGLRVDETRDDRLDLFRATDAAARYLHDLYAQFGDWKLALAAYNTGEANVSSAILRAHTQDFDQLASLRVLPLETRNYVPRILAAAPSIAWSSTRGEDYRATNAFTVFAVSNR